MTALANIISKEIFFLHQYIFHTEEYNDSHLQQHLSYTYYILFHCHQFQY